MNRLTVRFTSALIGVLLFWTGLGPAHGEPAKPDISARLLVGDVDAGAAESWIGLHVRLGPGWKTYWKSPGDAGLPPEFDWSGSTNVAGVDLQWPAPKRQSILGIETIGYADEVMFPIRLRRADPERPATVRLTLTLYACSTICVRDEHTVEAHIQSGSGPASTQAVIDRWRAKVPQTSSADLTVTSITRSTTDPARLFIEVQTVSPPETLDVFVDGDPPVAGDKPQVRAGNGGKASLTVALPDGSVDSVSSQAIHATVVAGEMAIVATSPPSAASASTGSTQGGTGLWAILVTAVLGGLILNLMPCVFPVLALKIFGLVNPDNDRPRAGLLATAAGILASFLVLAGALNAAKAAGATIGWGVQFQQPWFLASMIVVLAVFSASLFDLLHLRLPSALGTRVTRSPRPPTLLSQFASGFVATLLATPCSAPLVGTAVAFSLSQGLFETLVIFAGLGIGMSLPYLLLAAFPTAARRIPRPGPWLGAVKGVMALALLGSAVWLLVVLAAVSGPLVAITLAIIVAMAFIAIQMFAGRSRAALAAQTVALGICVGAASLMTSGPAQEAPVSWRPFAEPELRKLVQSGQTVFVDVTADWCVTCKVNKALVIHTPEIAKRLRDRVVPMQADWTKPDEAIAQFMKRHGRYGLPFNVVFGPGAPNGIVLSELLTKPAVLDALEAAGTPSQPN